ncbi:hypothetical protein RYX36_019526 [Vicia faba]
MFELSKLLDSLVYCESGGCCICQIVSHASSAFSCSNNCFFSTPLQILHEQLSLTQSSRYDRHGKLNKSLNLKQFRCKTNTNYLGRPWQKYSRTVVMKSNIDGVINSQGWAPWSGSFALSTLYYGEYMNVGDCANTNGRVNWSGFHVITNPSEAVKFSVGNFLAGESWISGVPFDASL